MWFNLTDQFFVFGDKVSLKWFYKLCCLFLDLPNLLQYLITLFSQRLQLCAIRWYCTRAIYQLLQLFALHYHCLDLQFFQVFNDLLASIDLCIYIIVFCRMLFKIISPLLETTFYLLESRVYLTVFRPLFTSARLGIFELSLYILEHVFYFLAKLLGFRHQFLYLLTLWVDISEHIVKLLPLVTIELLLELLNGLVVLREMIFNHLQLVYLHLLLIQMGLN